VTLRAELRRVNKQLLGKSTRNLPKLSHLSLELLFAVQVLVHVLGNAANTTGSAFIDGEFLIVALELSSQLFHALFEMRLARLSTNQRFPRLGEFLGLGSMSGC
jgi:hypothetical protein